MSVPESPAQDISLRGQRFQRTVLLFFPALLGTDAQELLFCIKEWELSIQQLSQALEYFKLKSIKMAY